MAVFATKPKLQFFDVNGEPLSGGKVYTYEVGTTTDKATYPTLADADAATNPNANPIILDSRGEATVCLTGPTKFTIDDSDDNLIYAVDNYFTMSSGDLYDTNGEVVLTLTQVASPTSNIEVKSAATGVDPELRVNGEADRGIILKDSNGNELLQLTAIASAVNYIEIGNVATGSGLTIECVGDDTNIDFIVQPKGTGVVDVKGTATAAAEVRLGEDTTNGTNYIGLRAPDDVSTSLTYVLPSADGSAGQVLSTNGSGVLSWVDKN